MKLIIESGATKSDWRLIADGGVQVARELAEGMNISTMEMSSIEIILNETGRKIKEAASETVTSVHFYTAGVITESAEKRLRTVLGGIFIGAEIELQTDLVAAARAVCGRKPGIAAILGTGSNSCQWDGTKIVKRVYSGGFILGDEGSAATLGKLFLADLLKGLVPETIAADFASGYDASYAGLVENVYRSQSPSAYLGSLAPFIMEHYEDPYIKSLVEDNIRAFFRRCILQYDADVPVGIIGGFGYALKETVSRIACEEGVKISGFLQCPIDGLIQYHK